MAQTGSGAATAQIGAGTAALLAFWKIAAIQQPTPFRSFNLQGLIGDLRAEN
jgi:hypothetical protein